MDARRARSVRGQAGRPEAADARGASNGVGSAIDDARKRSLEALAEDVRRISPRRARPRCAPPRPRRGRAGASSRPARRGRAPRSAEAIAKEAEEAAVAAASEAAQRYEQRLPRDASPAAAHRPRRSCAPRPRSCSSRPPQRLRNE